MSLDYREPTDPELGLLGGLLDRACTLGWPYIGPLTREQAEVEGLYEAYQAESWCEHEAQLAAGGREVCPQCGQRAVVCSNVCTLGYPGHPGAEFSVYRHCQNCNYQEL